MDDHKRGFLGFPLIRIFPSQAQGYEAEGPRPSLGSQQCSCARSQPEPGRCRGRPHCREIATPGKLFP